MANPIAFQIDNFKPFIRSVSITTRNTTLPPHAQKIYHREWLPSNAETGTLRLSGLTSKDPLNLANQVVTVSATASESLRRLRAKILNLTDWVEGAPRTYDPADPESWGNQKWDIEFHAVTFTPDQCYQVAFEGEDLHGAALGAGNQLLSPLPIVINCQAGTGHTFAVPHRTGANTWSTLVGQGADYVHKFIINDCGQRPEAESTEDCFTAQDIEYNITNSDPNTPTGAIDMNINSNGASDLSFTWTDEAGTVIAETEDLANVPAGWYCIEVKYDCCTYYDCIEIENCALAVTEEVEYPVSGQPNGVITLTVTSGTEPYQFLWSNGATTNPAEGLTPGTYTVTVEDARHCTAVRTVHLQDCPEILVEAHVILHPPSSCEIADGRIQSLSLSTSGGTPPYSYRWEDKQGNILPYQHNLLSGEYCLVATDNNGCEGRDCMFLPPKHYPDLFVGIDPGCTANPVGAITLSAFDPDDTTQEYYFEWGNGEADEGNHSLLLDLFPGTYCVTITSETTGCTVEACYEVPIVIPASALAVEASVTKPCLGQTNGSICLAVTGGVDPYTYDWEDVTNPWYEQKDRYGLAMGNYTVAVTDYCGTTEVRTFSLRSLDISDITIVPGCEADGYAAITASYGNLPYAFAWSNGGSANSVNGLISEEYCVTVTDAIGCMLTQCSDLVNKEYRIIQENRPCEGSNDGSIELKVCNPLAELVQITLDGLAQPLADPFATEITHQVPNLSSGVNYTLGVIIGSCSYTQPVTMPHKPVSNVFDRYNNNICFYDVYCGPNLIANDGYQEPPYMNFSDVHGGWLSKCYVSTYCGNSEVGRVNYSKKTVKGFVYYQILLDALVNSPHSSDYISWLIDFYEFSGINYCSKVRYCPANLQITSVFPGTNGQALSQAGCWSLNCNWPVGDEFFCMNEVVPNYFYSSNNPVNPTLPPVYICEPRTYNLFQLINWKDDLLAEFPNFLGTQLYNLITEWEAVEPIDYRIYCASVSFCLSDFTILHNNIGSIDCDPCPGEPAYVYSYGEPTPQPCLPEENSMRTKVYCKNSFCSGGGCCVYPVSLLNDFPGKLFFVTPPNDGLPPIRTLHGLPDRTDEFVNLGEAYSEGATVPKGLFRDQQGKGLYFDYFIHNTSAERKKIPNIKFSLEDMDNNSLAYISKEDNVLAYNLSYEDTLQDWTIPILSSGFLEVNHLSREGTQLVVAGQFQGTLMFGSEEVANATSISVLVLRVSSTGTLLATRTIGNFDPNTPLTFERSENNLLISGRTGSMALEVNGQAAIVESQPGQYFTLEDRMNTATYEYHSNLLNTSAGVTLLKTAHSKLTGDRTYLFGGTGTVEINSQTIAHVNTNQMTLVNLTPLGTLAWVNTLHVSSYDATELDLTEGDNGSVFLGMTFTDTLTASNQIAISNGGKDVAILKYEINGILAGIQSFGSNDDEEVQRCVFSGENLYFGGNYHGLTFERLIGSNIYENYPGDSVYSKAYITYLPSNAFGSSINNRPLGQFSKKSSGIFCGYTRSTKSVFG